MGEADTKEFDPGLFLGDGTAPPTEPAQLDLVILNQPILDLEVFKRLWRNSRFRICADGGANRLHDMLADNAGARATYLPDCIHGDLDSLRPDVRAYYASQGVDVTQDHGQYSTDFGKVMEKIKSRPLDSQWRDVVILGTLSGRVDQGVGLLHEMLREETWDATLRLCLFSESSVSFILRDRNNAIHGMKSGGLFRKESGILPVYGPANITTTGFEWDLKDWHTQMGGQTTSACIFVATGVTRVAESTVGLTLNKADGASSDVDVIP